MKNNFYKKTNINIYKVIQDLFDSPKKFPKTTVKISHHGYGICNNVYFINKVFFGNESNPNELDKAVGYFSDFSDRKYLAKEINDLKLNHLLEQFKSIHQIEQPSVVFLEPDYNGGMLKHYFHFIEHLIGLWSLIQSNNIDPDKIKNVIMLGGGNVEQNFAGINDINKHLAKALFPNSNFIQAKKFHEICDNKIILFKNVIFSDRTAIHQELPKSISKLNKMLSMPANYISHDDMESFKDKILDYFNIVVRKREMPILTYVIRNGDRKLEENLEKDLFDEIKKLNKFRVQKIDFAKLPFSKQVQIVSNTDILFGVHGNGLTHLIFLPSSGKVIEIFPDDVHHLDYRMLADLKGIEYTGVDPIKGIYSRKKSYSIGAIGIPTKIIEKLNIPEIIQILKNI